MPGRHLTDCQVRRYVKLRTKNQPSVAAAAAKAGFSTATGYRLESDPRLSSQKRTARSRRRPDPLAGIFEEDVIPLLQQAPDLRAVTVLEWSSPARRWWRWCRRRCGCSAAPHRQPAVTFRQPDTGAGRFHRHRREAPCVGVLILMITS